jgi:diguanylate cyclase (GGDEF)-like protein
VNDADLRALAGLLDGLGLQYRMTDAHGRVLIADPRGEPAAGAGTAVEFSAGRRLTVHAAAGAAPAAVAPAPAAEPVRAPATDPAGVHPDASAFEELLSKEWRRARRERSALGLLLVEIDQLDVLGGQVPHDIVERLVARVDNVIRKTLRRAADSVMRVGRGRFAVVMPNTAIQGAMDVAEFVRKAVVATDFNALVPGGYPVTVSAGVAASVPLPGIVALSLVHGADAALAEAHRKGSNRVWMLQ